MILATIDSVRWRPEEAEFPKEASFLLLTSALGKVRGLMESGLQKTFVAWSPENPPPEPNHLSLDGLIREKAKNLTAVSVSQLKLNYGYEEHQLPKKYLVQDVYPSLGDPGARGEYHLVKPKEEMGYIHMVEFMAKPWEKYGDKPVTVQLASAFAMVGQSGVPLGCRSVMQDSVFMTYSRNPLRNKGDVKDYIEFVKKFKFQGYSRADLVKELSRIAGGVFHEYLYLMARELGIEVSISSAMSCKLPEHESVYGIGAAGLTPAIVGWIDKQAKLRVH